MLNEAKELLAFFPELYGQFDEPSVEPDIIRSYDANSLMGIYLAASDLFGELVESNNESRAKELLSFAKKKLQEDRPNWPSDLSTAIIIGFFESFGQCENLWKHLNTWFSKDEYDEFKDVFHYSLVEEERSYVESLYT